MNWVVCKAFFPGVYERLNTVVLVTPLFKKEGEVVVIIL
jgi:hypothetical protein